MKKILFIFPEIFNAESEIRYPPFGLLDMASYLRSKNCIADIFDRNLDGNTLDRLFETIWANQYDILALSAMFIQKDDSDKILSLINERFSGLVVLGGDYFVTYKEKYSEKADYVVCGNGELFLEYLVNNNSVKRGIHYPPILQNLNEIPIPDKELLDSVAWDKRVFSLKTSRGCPFNCIFCSNVNNNSKNVRFFSAEYILKYMDFVKTNYGIHKFRFLDDIFTLNKRRILDLCDMLVRKDSDVVISDCFSHISINDAEIFKAMHKAGFESVQVGIESGNDEILKRIGKNITRKKITDTVNTMYECGLKVEGLYMIGNIGDTKETIKETIEFAYGLPTYKDWFSYACPLPNSIFYDLALENGTIIEHDYNLYTNKQVVYVPKGMQKHELEDLMMQAREMVLKKMLNNKRKKLYKYE